MKGRYNNYKNKYAKGGTFNQYGIDMIPDSAGLHHQSAYGGVPIGPNALAEGGEIKMDTPDGSQYIVSDQVDGTQSQMDFTFSKGGKYKELNRTLADGMRQDLSKYSMGSLATNSNSKEDVRRPNDSYAQSTIDQIKQKWQQKTEFARQRSQQQQAIDQAMQQKQLIEEEYIAAYGGKINPKKYPGLNMPKKAKGGYVYNAMTQPMLAHGGPMVSNVQQPFNGPAAQNRGGMMMANGGMIPQDNSMSKQIAAALQQGADPQQLLQQLIESGMDPQQAQAMLQAIMGKMQTQPQVPTEAAMMAMGGEMYAPGGFLDNFRSDFNHGRRMLFNKYYRNAYRGANNVNVMPNQHYEAPSMDPIENAKKNSSSNPSTTGASTGAAVGTKALGTGNEDIFGNDKLGKGLALGQAAIPLAESVYHMFNKPDYIKAPVVNAATVDYSGARTIDQRQTDMAERAYLDAMSKNSSTSGMFANNARQYLLQSNEDQASRDRISIENQMNTNAQKQAEANQINAQYRFNTDQLNYDIDQARLGNIFGSLNNAGTTAMQGYNDIANRKIQEIQARATRSANVTPVTGADGKVYMATEGADGYYFNGVKVAELKKK